jgi:hypothetical protein
VQRGFDQMYQDTSVEQMLREINGLQNTSLIKLNTLYTLAFIYSRNHLNNIINHNLIIPPARPIPNDCIAKKFD